VYRGLKLIKLLVTDFRIKEQVIVVPEEIWAHMFKRAKDIN
jgi:hypothetical protein